MRKVLSFVLVLTLVLGSFSMAFAADTTATAGLSDIKGNANEEAIKVAFDLGIVTGNPDGTFLPAKTVTRAEFAAMITRALSIPDSALAGYTATTFKDTAGYGWAVPYLAFCQSKGIMLGDGAGNAMPGRTINSNEAITMALRAVGYTANSAQLVGAWPANYVTLAQNLKLYDDVSSVTNVDKANAAQIIYNLLTVQKVAVNTDGKTDGLKLSDNTTLATLLNTGLGCTEQAASVVTGEETSLINLKPYVGDYAIKITKDSNKKVIAIKEVKSTAINGKFKTKDITSVEAITVGGVFTTKDDVEYKNISTATLKDFRFFENGENIDRTDDLTSTKSITINVKLDGKSITEAYSVERWSVNTAAKMSDGQIKALANDDVLLGRDFTKDDAKNIDTKSFELVGVNSLSDIQKDNVVYVYTKKDGKITKVTVGTEVITGKVTSLNSDGEYTIGGKIYELGPVVSGRDVAAVAVGNEIKAWLDANGAIYKAEKTGGTADTFGVVQFYQPAGINDAQVKLYTQDDTSKTLNIVADKDLTTQTAVGFAGATSLANASGYAVGYSLDKDGKIDTLNLRTTTSAVATLSGVKVIAISGSSLAISDKVVVFTSESGVGYDLSDINKIKTGDNIGTVYLTVNDKGTVVAMVVQKTAATKSAEETYGVLNSDDETYNEKLDKNVNQFVGFAGTATIDKLGSASYSDLENTSGGAMDAPVLYKIETDSDGFVKATNPNAKLYAPTAVGSTIAAINGPYAIKLHDGSWAQLASDVVVYEMKAKTTAPAEFDKYVASSADTLLEGYKVYLYDTNTDNGHEGYDYVVFKK